MNYVKLLTKLVHLATMDLVRPYRKFFHLTLVNSEELLDEVYRLRYDVYCAELGWEDPSLHPDGRESDEHDTHSVHILMKHNASGLHAGTVRLVKTDAAHPEQDIPLLRHYSGEFYDGPYNPLSMPKGRYGEISRLALRAEFRRRAGEQANADGQTRELFEWKQDERRQFPHIALGLYLAAAAAGLAEGLDGVYAMMEPRLARHLRFAGIRFEQVGPPVEFRGKRAPFYISRSSLNKHLSRPLKKLLRAIGDDLQHPTTNKT